MVMRRCLDCPALIRSGSRCAYCQARYRSAYARHDWADAVKARAGGRCERCGSADRVAAHHRLPLAEGGTDQLSNGVALCHTCHARAHGAKERRGGGVH